MNTWFVVHSKPRQESEAQRQLERQGYPVYLPRLCLPRLRRARWHDVTEPLFPRYLFVGLNVGEQSLAPIRSTRGVACVLRFGDHYAEVPATLLDTLRQRANPEGLHTLNTAPFHPGARVRIVAGPFEGLEAVFDKESGPDRARVLLEVLGSTTAMTLAKAHMVPVAISATRTNATHLARQHQ
jgi:transcriptional antiterminator RfaH